MYNNSSQLSLNDERQKIIYQPTRTKTITKNDLTTIDLKTDLGFKIEIEIERFRSKIGKCYVILSSVRQNI